MNIEYINQDKSITLIESLRKELAISSRLIRQLKKDKSVTVNEMTISFNARLRVGDCIRVTLPDEENIFEPENIPLDIVYEDEHLIVINKPPFRVVHPTLGHKSGTIANALAFYMVKNNQNYKIRFANRLDRDTSGLMIVCKNGYSQKIISDQMQNNSIVKAYKAICYGKVEPHEGTIDEPIGLESDDGPMRIVREDGQPSVTHYKVLKTWDDQSLVEVRLETGRTHQIRVHLKHIGHVIIGDELYGGNHHSINRQALHAYKLVFKNIQGEEITLEVDLPDDMKRIVD